MTREEMREYVRRLVDRCPAPTPEQRLKLALLLRPDMPLGIHPQPAPAEPGGKGATRT